MKNVRAHRSLIGLLALAALALALLPLLGARQGESDSPHGALGMDCTLCHGTDGWAFEPGRGFVHGATGFRLEGAHGEADCSACHGDLRFGQVASACADCHVDIHAGELGVDCESCHRPRDWSPLGGALSLHAARGFPLVGVHARVDCEACHLGAQGETFVGTPSDCFACHAADYAGTAEPDHEIAGMSTDCLECHSSVASGWGDSNFDHDALFPLTGAHARLDCAACHADGFGGEPTDCFGCHRSDYEQTGDPDHVAAQLGTDCATCHSTSAWQPAGFDHAAAGFPLMGGHAGVSCLDCHDGGYTNTPTDCYACHQTDYEGATDPDHAGGGFDTDCLLCHDVAAWEPATFDHASSSFPLTGGHAGVSCLDCHDSGYAGTPTDCYACHQGDYEGAEPDHEASGFGTQCESCHGTSAWDPSTWDHDILFPIDSGRHREEWNACVDCHVQPSDYAVFECIFCHEHNESDTLDKHLDENVDDYVYESAACFECHPRGEGE